MRNPKKASGGAAVFWIAAIAQRLCRNGTRWLSIEADAGAGWRDSPPAVSTQRDRIRWGQCSFASKTAVRARAGDVTGTLNATPMRTRTLSPSAHDGGFQAWRLVGR